MATAYLIVINLRRNRVVCFQGLEVSPRASVWGSQTVREALPSKPRVHRLLNPVTRGLGEGGWRSKVNSPGPGQSQRSSQFGLLIIL